MFDGEQFIAPRNSFPGVNFPAPLDPYTQGHLSHHQSPLQPSLLRPLHHHFATHKDMDEQDKQDNGNTPTVSSINFQSIQRERQVPNEHQHQHQHQLIAENAWTNDEVLALFRIRSTMETWFPDLTWEHVSRKLAELGFKRSADRCKEKFEEESRYLNNNINYTKNYRFLTEFEELYQSDDHQVENICIKDYSRNGTWVGKQGHCECDTDKVTAQKSKDVRKRKRRDKFQMFKDLCENIVNQMMAQQEEMHNKLLQDMLKRDEDKFAREEAWKKREMDMMNKDLDMMAHEQAIAGDRQATIIEFLNKFAAPSPIEVGSQANNLTVTNAPNINPTTPVITSFQNPSRKNDIGSPPSSAVIPNHQNITCSAENPSSSVVAPETAVEVSSTSAPALASTCRASSSSAEKEDVGRRWPRDEVLALINLRCCPNNTSGEDNNLNLNLKDGSNKLAPLWERISQGMLELGYKRSAKRCKEKWENINKYFRKTKDDVNKKRSLDSRTCPYFHQLAALYSQGKLVSRIDQLNHLNPSPTTNPSSVFSSSSTGI